MKDYCIICNKQKVSLLDKSPILLGLSIKCRNCKASYKIDSFDIFEDHFFIIRFLLRFIGHILEMLILPIIVVIIFMFMLSIQYAIITSILLIIGIIIFLKFIPLRIDETDNKNIIIERIQNKKNQQ